MYSAIGVEPTKLTAATSGMVQQRVDRLLVAVDDVEHAGGQAGFGQQFGDAEAGRGVALRRLQDEGVAAGERDREHPHRHHRREVERRDAGAHAERLAHRPAVDAAADLLGELALQQMRDAAGELDDLECRASPRPAASDSTLPCSSVIDARPARPRSRSSSSRNLNMTRARVSGGVAAQPGNAAARGLHRRVDLGGAAKRDAAGALAGRRVEHVAQAPARSPRRACRR